MKIKTTVFALGLVTLLMFNGCGGGGSSESPSSTNEETTIIDDTQEDPVVAGVTENTEPQASETFSYATQRDVNVSITLKETEADTPQKQVLIYEIQKTEPIYDEVQIDDEGNTEKIEVGEQTVFEGQLLNSSTDENHQLIETFTLGNHITSLWIVIPSEEYEQEISIEENRLSLELNIAN